VIGILLKWNRIDYELIKGQYPKKSKAFFTLRKIKENGAIRKGRNDKQLRGLFNSVMAQLKIALSNQKMFDHDLIIDLDYVITKLDKYSTRKKLSRLIKEEELILNNWRKQKERQVHFYKKLLSSSKEDLDDIAKSKEAIALQLEAFSAKRQKEVYEYWSRFPELKKYFVLETVLMHEVGGLDPTKLERESVLRVFENRLSHKFYSHLKSNQPLNKLLGKFPRDKWLDTLFKESEFSFTLWYFRASGEIFCPRVSKGVSRLRRENLEIIKKFLTEKRISSPKPILRYFSRKSMFARIDMTRAWHDYELIVPKLISSKEEDKEVEMFNRGQINLEELRVVESRVFGVIKVKQNKRLIEIQKQKAVKSYLFRDDQLFRYFTQR